MNIPILFEDNHLLVVEKPVNVPVQEDNSGDRDLLTALKEDIKVRYQKPGNVYLGLVHRLDRPVGGVMVFAKTSKAASRLSDAIRRQKFERTYLAVVRGIPQEEARLEHFLYKDQRNIVLPYMRERKRGKIINMSSISGKMGFPGLSPYVASKYALEGWTECLRLEVKPFGIDVALIEPGSYKTSIWSTGKKIAANSTLGSSPYSPYLKAIENQLEKGKSKYGDPRDVALLIVDLCMQKELQALRNPIGRGVKTALNLKSIIPWKLWEKVFFHKLKIKK